VSWITASMVVEPLGMPAFLADIFGRRPHHFVGPEGRFGCLLGWNDLNRILRHHRLAPPRLRIADLDRSPESIVAWRTGPKGERTPRLLSSVLRQALSDGATLVLDAVDEIHPPVAQLADELTRTFGDPVQANLYAGTKRSQGFGVHRDAHDVFVLQVQGAKAWTVYENVNGAAGPVGWTGELTSGDVLYVPRGWWHEVRAVGGPTLHITFGMPVTTGSDFLSWVLESMKDCELHKPVPRFATEEEREDFVANLRKMVREAISTASFERFLEDGLIFATSRPHSSLPFSVDPEQFPISEATLVRATYIRPPLVDAVDDEETVIVRVDGRQWRLPPSVAQLLTLLGDGRPRPVSELATALLPMPVDLVLSIVMGLLAQDLLEVEATQAPDSPYPSA
jgi:hypothetical protein